MSLNELCLGIDFGTTNSCLSIWHNNNAIIITDYDGSKTIPTIIEISNNKKVIGKEAYIRKNIFNNTSTSLFLIYEIKKLLGKKFSEIKNIESLAYTITNDGNDNIKIFNEIDNKFYFPEEIATQLFMSFKLRAEIFLNSMIEEGTINISASEGTINNISASEGTVNNLSASEGTINNISASEGTINNISASGGTVNNISASGGTVNNLSVSGGTVNNISASEGTINKAVISVPAYYNKNQREIIKKCAEMANLNVLRLINEPTAAALCYGLNTKINMDKPKQILVYDFGGGTLDISIVIISNDVYEVIETCGNSCLGGSDFDNCIMEYCITEFINKNSDMISISNDNISKSCDNISKSCDNISKSIKDIFIENVSENSLQKLKYVAEQAKITLTEFLNATIKIKNFYNNIDLHVSLSRETFNTICNDLINLAITPLNDIFTDATGDVTGDVTGDAGYISKEDIDEIIMVGGMTRVPIIRYNVERFFNKEVNCSIDPDNVVSIGAAIHGYMLTNKCNISDSLLLIDRTSLSIGLELGGGIMDILIPRGTIIPFKKTRKYTTDTDYMESIDIKIFEGERSLTKDNFLIGEFTLNGIEKSKRGIPEIMITFEIDANSIINIKAEDLNNVLNKKSIKITNNNKNLDEINKIIEIAKEMDEIDRNDKYKKMSYLQLKDNCLRIIESLNNEELKIKKEKKDDIINNVNEIYTWLCESQYADIDVEKYKELLHDFKTNYSLLMITPKMDINNINGATNDINGNGCGGDGGVEILDDDVNNKKYSEYIIFIRNLIEEYDMYNKQIFDENINNLFRNVYDLANDLLIRFFIETNITDDEVAKNMNTIKTYSEKFKNEYNKLNIELNILDRVIYKHKQVENIYLSLLDEETKNNNENKIDFINKILDVLIDYDTIIYKMTNNYDDYDENKLKLIESELDKLI
jgi:molecular chaperone DnaK (HSP70)